MNAKTSRIVGWGLSILLAVFLIAVSAGGKFTEWEGKEEMFKKIGYATETVFRIGVVEVICAILFLIPRTSFVGAVLLTAYLGGATATHVRIDEPFIMPVVMGVIVWVALGLRRPEVFRVAFGSAGSS